MKKRIEKLKQDVLTWLKVSTGLCFIVIFGAGLIHLWHGYEVNFEGKMIFWANPTVETQLAELPAEPPALKNYKRKG